MKYDIRSKNKKHNNKIVDYRKEGVNNITNIENESLNESLDYKYNNTFSKLSGGEENLILNGSFSKTLTKSKRKFDE